MQEQHSHIDSVDRYYFDNTLIPLGFKQLDSEQDFYGFGTWFRPDTLEMVEYAEGDFSVYKFESTAEFIGRVLEQKDVIGYLHIDDWDENWAPKIEREELETYMSYRRDDAIQ